MGNGLKFVDDLGILSKKPKLSQRGMSLTKEFEGFEKLPYYDSKGKLTSGYGFNLEEPSVRKLLPQDYLDAVGGDKTKDPTISEEQAEPIFRQLYQNAQDDAIKYLGSQEAFDKLDDDTKDNLVDMSYNLGYTKLKGDKSKGVEGFDDMKKELLKNNKEGIAREMKDSKWYGQTGRRGRHHVETMKGKRGMLDVSSLNLFAAKPAYADEGETSLNIGGRSFEDDLGILDIPEQQGNKFKIGENEVIDDLGILGTAKPEKRQYLKHLGKEFQDELEDTFIQPYKSFMGGMETAFSGTLKPLAVAYDFYADIITKATGIGDKDKKRWLEKVHDSFRDEGAKLIKEGIPEYEIDADDTVADKIDKATRNISRAVFTSGGSLAWKIPELMSMAKFLGMGGMGSLTMGVTEGMEATPEGGKEAAKQAAIGYGFHGIVKGISLLPRAIQLPTAFTTFGGVTAASGGSYEETIASGMLGVGLSLTGRSPSMKEFRSRYADVEWRSKYHKAISRRLKAKSIWDYRKWRQDAKNTLEKYGNTENLKVEVRRLLEKTNKNVTDAEVNKATSDIRNVWGKQVAESNRIKRGGIKLLTPEELLGFGKQVEQDIGKTGQRLPGRDTGISIEKKTEKAPSAKKYDEFVKEGLVTKAEVAEGKDVTQKVARKALKKLKKGKEITPLEQQAMVDVIEGTTEKAPEKPVEKKVAEETKEAESSQEIKGKADYIKYKSKQDAEEHIIDPERYEALQTEDKDWIIAPKGGSKVGGVKVDVKGKVVEEEPEKAEKVPQKEIPQVKEGIVEPLEEEARKFKSAEEFVEAQGELYHGTLGEFEYFLPATEVPEEFQDSSGVKTFGTYFTDNKELAKQFGDKIKSGFINKSKLLDLTTIKSFDDLVNLLPIDQKANEWELQNMVNNSYYDKYKPTDSFYKPLEDLVNKFNLVSKLKEVGYEGLIYNDVENGVKGKTFTVFEPKNIKTKQQLTDIWNKAQEKPLEGKLPKGFKETVQEKVDKGLVDKEEAKKILEEVAKKPVEPVKEEQIKKKTEGDGTTKTISDIKYSTTKRNESAQKEYGKDWEELKSNEKAKIIKNLEEPLILDFSKDELNVLPSIKLEAKTEDSGDKTELFMSDKMGEYITDGRVLIEDKEIVEKIRNKFWERRLKEEIKHLKETLNISYAEATKQAKKIIQNLRATENEMPNIKAVWETKKEDKLFEQIITHSQKDKYDGSHTVLLSDGKNQIAVNMQYYRMLKEMFPESTVYYSGEDKPILFYEGGVKKAILMPMRGGEIKPSPKYNEFGKKGGSGGNASIVAGTGTSAGKGYGTIKQSEQSEKIVKKEQKESDVRKKLEEDKPETETPGVGLSLDVSEADWEEVEVKEKAPIPKVESDTMKAVLKPFKAANDWLFTFGEQKRIDPRLYDKLMEVFHEISSRVENAIIGTDKVLGKKYTSTDRAEITFGVEEKSYQVPAHLEEVTNEIRHIRDELEKILLDDEVIKTGFIERESNELNEKQILLQQKIDGVISLLKYVPETQKAKIARLEKRIAKLEKQLTKVNEDIAQVEDLEFLTHRAVAKAVLQRKVEKMSDNNRTTYLANLRRVSFRYQHRAGIIPLRVFYQSGLLKKEDVDIFNILAQMLSEAQFRLTLKSLFNFYRENDYVYHRNKKNVPAHYQRFNPIVTGLIAPEYKNFWIHPLALSGLMEIKEALSTDPNPLKAIFSSVKAGQFIVPTIVWRYDLLQAAYGGALGAKTPIYIAKATKDVMNKTPFFQRANKEGVFQQAYLPVVGGRTETEMVQLAARQSLKDIPWGYKVVEKLFGMRMKKEDTAQILLASFRAISKFTWTGDRILRLASVYAYKDQKYSDSAAFKMAAQIHGAYADISPKARKRMSYIFFVHSFRILMPRFIWRIVYEPVKMVGGSMGGKKYPKRDWVRVAKGLAMFLLIPFLIDYYFTKTRGFKREVPLWKYYKEIDDEYEVVVNLNYIINNPIKYLARFMSYDPTRKETRAIQAITKLLKWEVHPVYRIGLDIKNNRKSIGYGRVYDESDHPFYQTKDIVLYSIMESYRILDWVFAEPDEAEGYSLTRAEQKELIEKEIKGVEGTITDLFGFKYIRKRKNYFKAFAYKRLERELYRRMRYANSDEKRDKVKLWFDKTKEWIEKKYKETK